MQHPLHGEFAYCKTEGIFVAVIFFMMSAKRLYMNRSEVTWPWPPNFLKFIVVTVYNLRNCCCYSEVIVLVRPIMDGHLPPFSIIIFVSKTLACKFLEGETTP